MLSNRGADPTSFVIADAVRFGGGIGASGQPRWREGAKAYLNYKGFPSTLGGVTIRPAYAEWLAGNPATFRSDFAFVSLHTNAGGGRGTINFSFGNGRGGVGPANRHPLALQNASDRLRDLVQDELIEAFRADFDPAWRDRGRGVANFGQLRENLGMPSCMLELAFHDDPTDAAFLRDPRFRAAAARAIYKGVLRNFDPNAAVAPLPPRALRLENLGQGELRVSWEGVSDPLEPSATPSGFKLYRSTNGWAFDDGVAVAGTSTVLRGLAPGERVFVRVSATNAGGEGQPGRVGGARVGDPRARALLVDGFTRAYRFTHDNWAKRYTYDYAREHVEALAATLPADVALDCAEHDALGAGVALGDYALVDWLLGRESSADRTFDPGEQQAVSAYLAQGGRLLVSGTEVAWDLGARGGGVGFLDAQLGAAYVADDAGVFVARPAVGGPFAALGLLDFSAGRYVPETPDVLTPGAGAEALLAYETGGAPLAGVGVRRRVVTLGFPLEAVGDPAQRAQLAQ
ncbi:MAG: N-acetylmuramoyl-L-alanine amidase, partial [Planctomycetes bacterium]|nr:N-acetylmuramoyl-L-alanine amidase [Planctomycetota bacterium]